MIASNSDYHVATSERLLKSFKYSFFPPPPPKSQLEELQKSENRIAKENSALVARNRTLETDLSQSQKACNDLKRALENHERDVKALKVSRPNILVRLQKIALYHTSAFNGIVERKNATERVE